MLALVVVFNPGLALAGRVLGGYDTFMYFYPLRSFIHETLGQGRLPLWNPYLFAGTPYLANPTYIGKLGGARVDFRSAVDVMLLLR